MTRERIRESGKIWLAALPVVAVAALILLFFTRPQGEAVRLVEVRQEELVSSLVTNGKVEPTENHELRATGPGFVRAIHAREGDQVRRGQVLMELERGQTQSEAARAEAELRASEAALQAVTEGGSAAELADTEQKLREARAARDEAARVLAANERLLARNAVTRYEVEQSREKLQQIEREIAFLEQRSRTRFSRQDIAQARARVEAARATLAQARRELGSTRVVAPAGGTLYSLPVRPGNFVNTGDLLAQTGNLKVVRVRTFVDEPELGRLQPGQEARVTWDALPGQEWRGQVERIPAEVTTLGTRTVGEVFCTIENQEGKLLANINVDVEIITARRPSTLVLPKEAVVHQTGSGEAGDQYYVLLLSDATVKRQPVKIGASSATRFEITSGVKAGDRVAVGVDRPVAEGARVRVVE